MDETLWWLMSIIGPAILLVILLWLVFRSRRRTVQDDSRAERATHELYDEEERRHREGTDDL
jgi:membrane protein implicated in regulation of membrane protease activity